MVDINFNNFLIKTGFCVFPLSQNSTLQLQVYVSVLLDSNYGIRLAAVHPETITYVVNIIKETLQCALCVRNIIV